MEEVGTNCYYRPTIKDEDGSIKIEGTKYKLTCILAKFRSVSFILSTLLLLLIMFYWFVVNFEYILIIII